MSQQVTRKNEIKNVSEIGIFSPDYILLGSTIGKSPPEYTASHKQQDAFSHDLSRYNLKIGLRSNPI